MFDVHDGESVFLNERPVHGKLRLTVGDSLMLGQSVAAVQMIRLTERDETKNG